MHDLFSGLGQLALQLHTANGADSATIKASLIAGLSLLGATCITAAATTFQRSRQPEPVPAPAVDVLSIELRRRAETAETQLSDARARIDVLETLCWDNHINPHTGAATG